MTISNSLKGDISTFFRNNKYSSYMEKYLETDNTNEVRILIEKVQDELYSGLCENLYTDEDLREHNQRIEQISQINCLYSVLIDEITSQLEDVEKTGVFRETSR